ncbi:NHLP bacteriocin system secretion protein [Xanthobacteraceae bacterium A53D]
MNVSLFRSEAQVRRPDQLASALRLVRPGYLMSVVVLCAIVVAAVIGAILIKVPVMVSGTGVIISSKGVLEFTISSDHEGRITDLLVDVGQNVVPGQAIVRLVQPVLETDLKLAESELDLINKEQARVVALQEHTLKLFDDVSRRQEANALETMAFLDKRKGLLEQLAQGQEALRKSGNTTFDRYLQVQAELNEVMERTSDKQGDLLALSLAADERRAQYEREMQAITTRKAQAQRQIDRLRDRIRTETFVRSTQYGVVSELKVFPGDLVRFDTPLVSLLPVDESFTDIRPGGTHLVATVLLPAKDGKKVRDGMAALVDPTSVRRDVFGAIEGTVVRTSDVAASPEQLRHILRNDDLVRKLTANGPPFLVTVEMRRDPGTISGYKWTTSGGPDTQITAGTLLEARVLTERVSVLGLLVPAVKDLLRGPNHTGVDF